MLPMVLSVVKLLPMVLPVVKLLPMVLSVVKLLLMASVKLLSPYGQQPAVTRKKTILFIVRESREGVTK